MTKKLFSCFIILFAYFNFAMAQEWSKEDSIWLQNVLEGKEVLKLNESAKKAIEDGRLIIPSLMKKNEYLHLDIIIDFNKIGRPSPIRKIDPYSMPPAVFSLYIQKMVEVEMGSSIYSTYSFKLTDKEKAQLKTPKTSLSSMIVPFNTDPLHTYGGVNLLNVVGFLMNLFWGEQEKQNKKNPIPPMTEIERRQINQEINRLRQLLEIGIEQEK
jgi:hypothetical protein